MDGERTPCVRNGTARVSRAASSAGFCVDVSLTSGHVTVTHAAAAAAAPCAARKATPMPSPPSFDELLKSIDWAFGELAEAELEQLFRDAPACVVEQLADKRPAEADVMNAGVSLPVFFDWRTRKASFELDDDSDDAVMDLFADDADIVDPAVRKSGAPRTDKPLVADCDTDYEVTEAVDLSIGPLTMPANVARMLEREGWARRGVGTRRVVLTVDDDDEDDDEDRGCAAGGSSATGNMTREPANMIVIDD